MSEDLTARMKFSLSLRARDVAATKAWYRQVFGIEPFFDGVDTTLEGQASPILGVKLAGVKVFYAPRRADMGEVPPHAATIALLTGQDLVALRKALAARGARFDDASEAERFPPDADGIRHSKETALFWVLDPDGNRIELCRVKEPQR